MPTINVFLVYLQRVSTPLATKLLKKQIQTLLIQRVYEMGATALFNADPIGHPKMEIEVLESDPLM